MAGFVPTCRFFGFFSIPEVKDDRSWRSFLLSRIFLVPAILLRRKPRSTEVPDDVNQNSQVLSFRSQNDVKIFVWQSVDLKQQVAEFVDGADVAETRASRFELQHRRHHVGDGGQQIGVFGRGAHLQNSSRAPVSTGAMTGTGLGATTSVTARCRARPVTGQ